MGSWAAFYVKGRDEAAVVEACRQWLHDNRGTWARLTKKPVRKESAVSIEHANNWTLLNPSKKPRRVAVYKHSERWGTAFCGSFFTPNALAEHVSKQRECIVVDTQAQNTSDAYLVSVFDNGARKRELEFAADVGWVKKEGAPLPKEPEPLETEPDGDGWFDQEAVGRYMRSVFDIGWWELPASGTVTLVG